MDDKNPINLEGEFISLMQELSAKIKANKEAGLYDEWDATVLQAKVQNVIDHGDTSRYGEQCPEGHGNIDECGWSPSMGYHCT